MGNADRTLKLLITANRMAAYHGGDLWLRTDKMVREPGTSNENTLLHLATFRRSTECIDVILETGLVGINDRNAMGATALHIAIAEHGDASVIARLLSWGADVALPLGYPPELKGFTGGGIVKETRDRFVDTLPLQTLLPCRGPHTPMSIAVYSSCAVAVEMILRSCNLNDKLVDALVDGLFASPFFWGRQEAAIKFLRRTAGSVMDDGGPYIRAPAHTESADIRSVRRILLVDEVRSQRTTDLTLVPHEIKRLVLRRWGTGSSGWTGCWMMGAP